jgi:glycosyltransferase involved in cell wall biosynthesis
MTPRRITLVANEIRGAHPVGGAGTATTFLALALARAGHDVEILHSGTATTGEIDPAWTRTYADADVRIRFLDTGAEAVEPPYFAGPRATEQALRADPPDVVIAQDGSAAAYTALRLRQLGLAFERTLFVVFCHGTRGWIKDVSRNVRVFPNLLGVTVLERQSVELADVVVSPSAYLLGWMRSQDWQLPQKTVVIPYLTRSVATGEAPAPSRVGNGPVTRIVYFGRLDERKGVRPLVAAVNALERELLEKVELEFLGAAIPMTAAQVETLISERAKSALRGVSFETDLDQQQAIARLSQPGSLAVMPSLEDNSPNTVYECLEHAIPFIASGVGGTHELVAAEDRDRVLFEPTASGVEAALRRALGAADALRPARAAFDPSRSLEAWEEVLTTVPSRRDVAVEQPRVETVKRRSHWGAALGAGSAPFVLFLDEDDEPDEHLLQTLVQAQVATRADVVTCGLRLLGDDGRPTLQFFLGEPGALGMLSNSYGNVALIRRALLDDVGNGWPVERDPAWPLLAGLSDRGARIVSVPLPLVTRTAVPGTIGRDPSDALLVVEQLERAMPDSARSLARLAAGLAADAQSSPTPPGGTLRRALRRLTAANR